MKAIKKATLMLMVLAVLLSFSTASAAVKKAETSASATEEETEVLNHKRIIQNGELVYDGPATTEPSVTAEKSDDKEQSDKGSEPNYSFSEKTVGNAELTANEEVLTDNGIFRFIAVTTRGGDVFYVIIDETKEDNNVYFLNDVDTYDLQSLLNKDEDGNTKQIEENSDSEEEAEEAEEEAETEKQEEKSATSSSNSSLLILVGIIILGGIGFAIFKLKNGGFGKKKNDEYIDDDFEDEEEINEDKEMVTS